MTRSLRLLLLGIAASALAGCGVSSQVITQRHEIAYQGQVAHIIDRLTRSPAAPRVVIHQLGRAIGQLERVGPPAPVRRLHAHLVSGLRSELGALRRAVAPGADTATIHAAVAADARARDQVNTALRRMTTLIGSCRADAARC